MSPDHDTVPLHRPAMATSYAQRLTIPAHAAVVTAALTTAPGLSSWLGPTIAIDGMLKVSFPASDNVLAVRVSEADGIINWIVVQCAELPDWIWTSPKFILTAHDDGWTDMEFVHEGLTPQLDCYEQSASDWNDLLLYHLVPNLPH